MINRPYLHRKPEPKPHTIWWRLWAKSLGQKTAYGDTEADTVAWIRTVFVLTNFITCIFIIAGIIRHW
jgi:hypothetical protein